MSLWKRQEIQALLRQELKNDIQKVSMPVSIVDIRWPYSLFSSSSYTFHTHIIQHTSVTSRFPCAAAPASVEYQAVMGFRPARFRQYLHKRELCFEHVLLLHQPYLNTWVSTAIRCWPKPTERTTFAVFLPTPGRATSFL